MSTPPPPLDPRLKPTSAAQLLVAGLAAAAAGWLLLSVFYADMPRLPWLPTVVVGALAVAEALLANDTRGRIERRPGRPRVDPLAVARYAVLAKASSLAGALYAGFSAGLLGWLAVKQWMDGPNRAIESDVPAAIAGVVASLALVGAALWLERACRVPKSPDEDDPTRRG